MFLDPAVHAQYTWICRHSSCLFICPLVSLICMASLTFLFRAFPPNTSVTSILNLGGSASAACFSSTWCLRVGFGGSLRRSLGWLILGTLDLGRGAGWGLASVHSRYMLFPTGVGVLRRLPDVHLSIALAVSHREIGKCLVFSAFNHSLNTGSCFINGMHKTHDNLLSSDNKYYR